ncbi:MAG: HDIG domain-containing metalloprotein [Bacillota bacterium]
MGVVKRILNSWFTKLTPEDLSLTDFYLDEPGKFLFFQMSKIDQQHALTVARGILAKATTGAEKVELMPLVTAALLHDVGKIEGDFNFFSRILVGIVRRVKPALRGRLAKTYPVNFWEKIGYGFYVDLVHPARGAHMARIFGVEPKVVEMIRHHHDPPRLGQSIELTWLQLVDGKC